MKGLFCGMEWHSIQGHKLMLAARESASLSTGSQPRAARGAILSMSVYGIAGDRVYHQLSAVTP